MNNKPGRLQFWSLYLCFALVSTFVTLTLTVHTSRADLLFSDSFDYPPGLLDGNGPPPNSPPGQSGWTALLWKPRVGAQGLQFPGINAVGNSARLRRNGYLTGDTAVAELTPFGVGGSGTAWIGFLMKQDSETYPGGYAAVTFNDMAGPTAPQFGVTFWASGYYAIDNSSDPVHQAVTPVYSSPDTVWLVVKLDFDKGREFLFVNPSRLLEPTEAQAEANLRMEPEFQTSGFDRIGLKEGYNFAPYFFDELRVGTAFADLVR